MRSMEIWQVRQKNLELLARNHSREELASALDYADTNYLNQLIRGHARIGDRTAKKIYEKFELESLWLETPHPNLWGSEDGSSAVNDTPAQYTTLVQVARIPEISWVAASGWDEAIDLFEPGDAYAWHSTTVKCSSRTYALKVRGDSMVNPRGRPTYFEDDVILVDPEQRGAVTTGDRVIALLADPSLAIERRVTFKSIIFDGSQTYLKPLNPAWDNIRDEFTVLGKILSVIGP